MDSVWDSPRPEGAVWFTSKARTWASSLNTGHREVLLCGKWQANLPPPPYHLYTRFILSCQSLASRDEDGVSMKGGQRACTSSNRKPGLKEAPDQCAMILLVMKHGHFQQRQTGNLSVLIFTTQVETNAYKNRRHTAPNWLGTLKYAYSGLSEQCK